MNATLEYIDTQTSDVTTFWLKPEKPMRYTAGQFIELTLTHDDPDDRGQTRWFTLSSSPSEELLAITTRFQGDQSSSFKQALFSLQLGNTVAISEPMGDFVLPMDILRPLVFVAGGIGITPMRSMVKWLLDAQQQRTIHLLYAAHTIDDVLFRDVFHDYGLPTDIILSDPPKKWKGHAGQLSADTILKLAPNVDDKLYYISGPEPMVETLAKNLQEHGVNQHNIAGDYFPNYPTI